ncbi:MAG: caspase family protein [Campylobacterota bacterium]|nr:caspase family protein [Campylobacterota bacterium]
MKSMKKLSLIFIVMFVVSLNATVKNPYENISDKDKLNALTNYLINQKYNLVKSKFEKVSTFQKRVKYVNDNIDEITAKAIQQSYSLIYGKPVLKAVDYDAENEIFYGELDSSKGSFTKKIAIKVPLKKAESFYNTVEKITPKLLFNFEQDNLTLQDIVVLYKGKEYLAMLRTDYKANRMDIAIKKQAIKYSKDKTRQLVVDDLPKLLANSKKVKKNQKSYAVIFGIEDYMLESNVNYSQNSAMSFMQYSSKLLGVPDDNIWAFVGNKTSSGFIKSQWNDFLSLVEDDATIYFYYSGHGVPGSDGNAYILPSDTNAETATNDKTFMLKNIYANLSKTKAKKVVAFVDSCFSGKDDKGSLLFEGVAPVLKVKKTKFDTQKMTIFTAGSSKHFSNQYKEKKQRLFSYFLMKGLALGKTDTKELFSYVKTNVANKSRKLGVAYKQIPQLLGKNDGKIR